MMKKTILTSLVGVMLTAGCSGGGSDQPVQPAEGQITVSASMPGDGSSADLQSAQAAPHADFTALPWADEQSSSRLSLDNTGLLTLWSTGDKLRIAQFDASGTFAASSEYTLASGQDTRSGKFTGSALTAGRTCRAYYPSAVVRLASYTAGMTFTVPELYVQSANSNSAHISAGNVMYSDPVICQSGIEPGFALHQAMSLLEFNVTLSGVAPGDMPILQYIRISSAESGIFPATIYLNSSGSLEYSTQSLSSLTLRTGASGHTFAGNGAQNAYVGWMPLAVAPQSAGKKVCITVGTNKGKHTFEKNLPATTSLRAGVRYQVSLPLGADPDPATMGLWTSRSELSTIPMSGNHWDLVIRSADRDTSLPNVGNQDDNTNCYVLAAAIASERYYAAGNTTKGDLYRDKVIKAVEKIIADGCPSGSRSLAWGREIGAYVMAADLVGYRTAAFEQYLRDASNKWICSERKQTLHAMALNRPNNWGTMGFGTLCAIYAYLGDETNLVLMRTRWLTTLVGPSHSGFKYGDDLSWQADPSTPMVINKKNTSKDGFILDGLQPEEMRRGDVFKTPPAYTDYPFEALNGLLMGARILDRLGKPIWEEGDRALYRAYYAIQVYLVGRFGSQWIFTKDDIWSLTFIDAIYGSNLASISAQDDRGHGKNAGYGYVTLGDRK